MQIKNWILAARLRTLGAAVAPVLIGTALAFGEGYRAWPAALAALLCALLLQVGTNYANDYFDFRKGADTADRLGPTRVTQAGLIAPEQVRNAFVLIFALVALPGAYLVHLGGWPILLLGALSVLSGVIYTGGPFALAYVGLGDLFVLLFFGGVATGATYYTQSGQITPLVLLAALGPGLLSTAILTVNNLRDRLTDAKTGKKTLAVRFGAGFARAEYLACWLGALAVPPLIWLLFAPERPAVLLACLTAIPARKAIQRVFSLDADPALNPLLGQTGKLLLLYSLLFSLGWLLGGVSG